jgi:hypothetical protein
MAPVEPGCISNHTNAFKSLKAAFISDNRMWFEEKSSIARKYRGQYIHFIKALDPPFLSDLARNHYYINMDIKDPWIYDHRYIKQSKNNYLFTSLDMNVSPQWSYCRYLRHSCGPPRYSIPTLSSPITYIDMRTMSSTSICTKAPGRHEINL